MTREGEEFENHDMLSRYFEDFALFSMVAYCCYYSKSIDMVALAKKCMASARKFGTVSRRYEIPEKVDDSQLGYNINQCRFDKNGITRFVIHNFYEIAVDSIMYVFT